LSKQQSYVKKMSGWLISSKTEQEQVESIDGWVVNRFEFFGPLFMNIVNFHEQFMSNSSTIWSSLFDTFSNKQFVDSLHKPIEEVSSSISGILENPIAIDYFKKFLDQERSAENLNFILDVDCYIARHSSGSSTDEDFVEQTKKKFTTDT